MVNVGALTGLAIEMIACHTDWVFIYLSFVHSSVSSALYLQSSATFVITRCRRCNSDPTVTVFDWCKAHFTYYDWLSPTFPH
ncbi:hypothetical protein KHA80_00510 [Anaerobacillus sp. HL2]|nr:hypothetical protein KHA80_00510 [Anaerobacillus sp. HL2]